MRRIRQALRSRTPWWAKMSARMAIAGLPGGERLRRSLGLDAFGGMENPDWAYDTFTRHVTAARFGSNLGGLGVLELGPGDSLATALIAHALGASATWLVDVGPFASRDPAVYRALVGRLAERGHPVGDLEGLDSLDALLAACNARYLTGGFDSLRAVPDASVDFLFSNAVLQAVRRSEVLDTLKETRRVLRPGGVCSHSVGIWDLAGDALNHLRFPPEVWETDWVYRSGFYTNRFRFSELLDLFRQAGFRADVTEVNQWDRLPTPRSRMHPSFRGFTDADLLVYSFNVTLRPAPVAAPALVSRPAGG